MMFCTAIVDGVKKVISSNWLTSDEKAVLMPLPQTYKSALPLRKVNTLGSVLKPCEILGRSEHPGLAFDAISASCVRTTGRKR